MDMMFNIQKAHEAQRRLCQKLILQDELPEKIQYVAGVDTAYWKDTAICAVAVLHYPSMKKAEVHIESCKVLFPYVPTLLSFRETPPSLLCIRKLELQPDIFLVDGHGYAHPFRCGFASHLGIVLKKPTTGVAKSRLTGDTRGESEFSDVRLLMDMDEIIGAEATTTHGVKPVYVSIGHKVSLKTAIEIVKNCTVSSRIPEPLLIAHRKATDEIRKLNSARTNKN